MTDNCPHCDTDLQGGQIPGAAAGERYQRAFMVEIRGVYDGGLFFMCPDCSGKWHRWPKGHPLHEKAKVFVDDPNWGLRKAE